VGTWVTHRVTAGGDREHTNVPGSGESNRDAPGRLRSGSLPCLDRPGSGVAHDVGRLARNSERR